jgi:hypothetical protein
LQTAGDVASAQKSIEELAAVGQKISAIGQLIAGVAGQTKLLALNAKIEAARVGKDGDGFAVVADEVKALAERAADATQQVHREVQSIKHAVRKATTEMNSANDATVTIVQALSQGHLVVGRAAEQIETTSILVREETNAIHRLLANYLQGSKPVYRGNAEEAMALIERVERCFEALGETHTLEAMNSLDVGFVDRDLFVWAMDLEGNLLANPYRPNLIGTNVGNSMRDADGNFMNLPILERAKSELEFSVRYRFDNPVTKQSEWKTTLIRVRGNIIFATGFFDD